MAPVPASPLASGLVEAAGCLTARAAAEPPHGTRDCLGSSWLSHRHCQADLPTLLGKAGG